MVVSTQSAVRVVPAPPLPPASVMSASPQGAHCLLKVAEFESCPEPAAEFVGTLYRLGTYQRFRIWAAGDRFVDMCAAISLGFKGWSLEPGSECVG